MQEKYSDIKMHETLFNRSQVVPCGQTERQAWRIY